MKKPIDKESQYFCNETADLIKILRSEKHPSRLAKITIQWDKNKAKTEIMMEDVFRKRFSLLDTSLLSGDGKKISTFKV